MTNLYTVVGTGYACRGRKTREDAIKEAHGHYSAQLASVQANLEAIEKGTVEVFVQKGLYRETVLEVL